MKSAARLVTYVDIDDPPSRPERVSVSARHELELADGRRVLLLDDRGWGGTAKWTEMSVEEIQETSRMVVGPDGPPEGRSQEEEDTLHWVSLQQTAQRKGVDVDAGELRRFPHDVILSQRLLARIGADSETGNPG